jgi:hypothetical protein
MSVPNPHESDLVLGGQNPPPIDGAILGGLAGVKQRLTSESIVQRLKSLNNAVQYGERAIDLARQALKDEAHQVRRLAKILLRNRLGEAGKEALLTCDPMSYFTMLNDWEQETYNPEIGIVSPVDNAYLIYTRSSSDQNHHDLTGLETLLKDPHIADLQALIIKVDYYQHHRYTFTFNLEILRKIFNLLIESHNSLPNLKALYIGDRCDDSIEKRHSELYVFDLSPLLNAFPNLECFHIYADTCTHRFNNGLNHPNLKTLILDSTGVNANIFPNDMPNLELFEIWLDDLHSENIISESMLPILSGKAAPKLKYLGFCNPYRHKDSVFESVLNSIVLKQLRVLSLQMFDIQDEDIAKILNCSDISNLSLLNISNNCISADGIKRLNDLSCCVNTANQYSSIEDGMMSIMRYKSSYANVQYIE